MRQYLLLIQPFGKTGKWTYYTLTAVMFILLFAFWHAVTGDDGLIPSPVTVLRSFFHIVTTKDFLAALFGSILLTVKAMLLSVIIALLIGYLSVIPVFSPLARFIMQCRYLTIAGLYFVFILISKNADSLKLSLLVFAIVPFFVTSLLAVISNIRQEEYDACRSLRYNQWQILYELIIRGRMDQTLEIIRQNFAITWLMIVTVESSALSGGGIGVLLYRYNKYNDLKNVLALQIVILLVGILTDLLLAAMRRELFPYTKLTNKQ